MRNKLNTDKIKAVLFDSGRVLNRPVTGHWFITPNFFNYVNEKNYKSIERKQRDNAFKKAGNYISLQSLIINEEEEFSHFLEYYRIFSTELPQLKLKDEQIKAIAEDLVYNYNKYKFFKDAIDILPALSKKYKLAVVSDAWPSLENVFKSSGVRDYFSSFVVSSIKGVTKPHELMYKSALDELGILPEEAIFIDDSIKNCDGARSLEIQSFVLSRDWRSYFHNRLYCKNHNIIQNLNQIKKLLL